MHVPMVLADRSRISILGRPLGGFHMNQSYPLLGQITATSGFINGLNKLEASETPILAHNSTTSQ